MDATGNGKRPRDVLAEAGESPREKRSHAVDLSLLDILEDVDEVDVRGPAGDLATVMKSFEEEIAAPSPASRHQVPEQAPETAPEDSGLDFLLEASDDVLGLPPPSDGGEASGAGPPEGVREALEAFGQLWALDDGADGLGIVGFDATFGGDEAWVLDGDLFGSVGVAQSAPSDVSDLPWRSGSLPAV